jgi:hypothetical protein
MTTHVASEQSSSGYITNPPETKVSYNDMASKRYPSLYLAVNLRVFSV